MLCELTRHYAMLQMKVLTLKANENIATNKNHDSTMLQHVENIAMYKNHKTMILQVKELQVDENIAMNKKHKNTILQMKVLHIKVQEIEMNNGQANLTTLL
jgi:hypothetical protein